MPINYRNYAPFWRQFSDWVRLDRANQRCECSGQCGLHRGKRCIEAHHRPARYAHGLIRLTVAHLCTCWPPCTHPSHVMAACQRCHLRIDRFAHARARAAKIAASGVARTNAALR